MTKKREIRVEQDVETIRIYIDNLPQCILKRSEFAGLCSYKQNGVYYIELWKPKGQRELLIYETRELWTEILKQLDNTL